MTSRSLIEVVHWLEEILQRVGLPHSYGGAIAYNYYGPPRLTRDVDVLVLVHGTRLPALVDEFVRGKCCMEGGGGQPVDLRALRRDLDGKAHFTTVVCSGVRIEIFAPWHPFHQRVLDRSPRRELQGQTIPIHSAEDLIVFKKIFDRPKDLQDIEGMLMAQRGKLDHDRIRWEAKHFLTDESYAELDALLKDHDIG